LSRPLSPQPDPPPLAGEGSALARVGAGAFVILWALAGSAVANDSTAELGTGGLDFVQNENVEMRSEQLFVSTEQIRVAYL
jgi:hypothetical protein